MNYGYDSTTKGWNPKLKRKLADELKAEVQTFNQATGLHAYVEVDQMYKGVRIRRITHASAELREELVKAADEIYNRIMGVCLP